MSRMTYCAFSVDMMLLSRTLMRVILAVGVPTLSGWWILSPPAMSHVRCFSFLFCLISQLKLPYVTSFILSFGTWSLQTKKMVFVPFTLPRTPWARHPNL
jgi:hypothetical protein